MSKNRTSIVTTIEPLADHPHALPLLQSWFEREWAPYYGPSGPGNAQEDLRGCCNRDRLPLALVAFADGQLCATAALKSDSVTTHKHLNPWLAALLVDPAYRRQGVATSLIAAIEERARQFGFAHLYAGTETGPGTTEPLLRQRGWLFLEQCPYFVSDIRIYKKRLSDTDR
jgi:GNAT superfamily N-acetyltransferase